MNDELYEKFYNLEQEIRKDNPETADLMRMIGWCDMIGLVPMAREQLTPIRQFINSSVDIMNDKVYAELFKGD